MGTHGGAKAPAPMSTEKALCTSCAPKRTFSRNLWSSVYFVSRGSTRSGWPMRRSFSCCKEGGVSSSHCILAWPKPRAVPFASRLPLSPPGAT